MSAGRGRLLVVNAWAALLVLGLLVAPHEAGAVKLNPSLSAGRAVVEAQLTPDGSRVVYLADQDTNGVFELYSVPANGGTVTKLNRPLIAGGNVTRFQITPDGSRVVYMADQDVNDVVELYSVPVAGGTIARLNDPLIRIVGGNVTDFQISGNSTRVVFLADQDTADHFELYSVPVAGLTANTFPTKLNGPIHLGSSVRGFQIAPNDSRVVFRGDIDTAGLIELYSVPILGGTVTRLSPLALRDDVVGFTVTPDSSRVVYRAAQDTRIIELYSVPIAGGTVTKLNGVLPADFQVAAFQITPNGSRVVFRARREIPQPPLPDIVTIEIYSVPVAGGAMTKLNRALPIGGSVIDFQITPDSARVVYVADQDVDQVFELYSVPVQGGTITKLNPALVAGGGVLADRSSTPLLFEGPQITPDSSRVVYRADQATDQVNELFSVAVGGGAATRLNPAFLLNRDVVAFEISPDGTRVVYLADQDRNGTNELYSVPVTGGGSTKVSQTLATGRTVIAFQIAPDSRHVIYLDGPIPPAAPATPDPDPVQELYSVEISTFTDVSPDNVLLPWIEALVRAGITSGCGVSPPQFCPELVLTRAQMAILLVRGKDGSVQPPPATGNVFVDVPAGAFGAAWIERLFALGITSGCQETPRRFCPDQGLTRAEMSVLLLRAEHGAGYVPPAATGSVFADVPPGHPLGSWIEQLAREGITGGCGVNPARFCPDSPLTRGQIAVFLVRIFHLAL